MLLENGRIGAHLANAGSGWCKLGSIKSLSKPFKGAVPVTNPAGIWRISVKGFAGNHGIRLVPTDYHVTTIRTQIPTRIYTLAQTPDAHAPAGRRG